MAKNANGKLFQGTDEVVNRLFNDALLTYASGKKTKEQALADFRTQVSENLKSDVLKRLRLILNEAEPASAAVTNNTPANTSISQLMSLESGSMPTANNTAFTLSMS